MAMFGMEMDFYLQPASSSLADLEKAFCYVRPCSWSLKLDVAHVGPF